MGWISLESQRDGSGQGWRVWIGSTSPRVPGVVRGSADALKTSSVTLWQLRSVFFSSSDVVWLSAQQT